MEQEPRKATDVLLAIESKVSMLLDIIRAQDLNIKILSNKLNDVMKGLEKQQSAPQKIIVEAVQHTPTPPATPIFPQTLGESTKAIPIVSEANLPQDNSPKGFRRNSRPETYMGDNAYLPHAQETRMPVQIPKSPTGQSPMIPPPGRSATPDPTITAPAPPVAVTKSGKQLPPAMPQEHLSKAPQLGQIPVMQRCVDKNGKSVFLADVEIVDKDSLQPVFKTRTNGTGKWMASLGIGAYRVTIKKRIDLSQNVEAVQDVQVDGTQSPLDLPMLIMK